MKWGPAVLLACVSACAAAVSEDSGDGMRPGGKADALGDVPRCGLDYSWLPLSSTGSVTLVESYEPVSTTWAKSYSFLSGLGLERSSAYETQAHRISYRTQDRGEPIEATGAVVVPRVEEPAEFPVLLVLHGTTGLNDDCAISTGWFRTFHRNYAIGVLASVVASYGYIVVLPDYVGIKGSGEPSPELHPYLVAEPTAIASLDAVRATHALLGELDTAAVAGPTAVWGGSQGGHGAAFTVRYAPHYAPSLDIRAAVYVAPPLDLARHWQRGMSSINEATPNVLLAFAGAGDWYELPLDEVFRAPLDTTIPEANREQCHPRLGDVREPAELFTAEILQANRRPALGGHPDWSCVLEENTLLTTSVPDAANVPSLVVLAENDNLVETEIERRAFREMCARGKNWAYLECEGLSHGDAFKSSIDDTLDFIDARLAGEPMAEGACALAGARRCANQ